MLIRLLPGSGPLFTESRTELTELYICSLLKTYRHGPHRKHNSFIVTSGLVIAKMCLPRRSNGRGPDRRKHSSSVATGASLPSRCPETALIYPPISQSLHSNGSTRYSMKPFSPDDSFTLLNAELNSERLMERR
jgi:hypothetical protein